MGALMSPGSTPNGWQVSLHQRNLGYFSHLHDQNPSPRILDPVSCGEGVVGSLKGNNPRKEEKLSFCPKIRPCFTWTKNEWAWSYQAR